MGKYAAIVVALSMVPGMCAEESRSADQVPPGWQFGVQAYSFRNFSFLDTVQKCAALGLKCVEMYPGQKIGGEIQGATGHDMDAATRAALKGKLAPAGVSIVAYGVVNAEGEAGWRKIFEFARDMGIGTIVIEPPQKELATVSKFCDEFKINAAIHNHAKPSTWWDPKAVKAAVEGLSKRLGACPDIGHWTRSGLDTVEGMKALEGRILAMHLKDVKEGEEWVALNAGKAKVAGVLAEMKRQGFKGPVSIEHEGQPEDPYVPIKQSVRFVFENAQLSAEQLAAGQVKPGDRTDDVADVSKGLDPLKDATWTGVTGEVKDDDTSAYSNLVDGKGKATASAPGFPNEGPEQAFDGNQETKYCVKQSAAWVQYQMDGKKEVVAYAIRTANDAPERDPQDWKLLGSTDGQQFEVLDERSNEKFKGRFHLRLFEVKKPGAYSVYRMDILKNASNGDRTQLADMELLVKK